MNEDLAKLVGWAVWIILPLVVIGLLLTAGFTSFANLIKYGQFTTHTRIAMVESHLSDSRYFDRLAEEAKISLVSSKIRTVDGLQSGNQGANAWFIFRNDSGKPHLVQISVAKIRIILNGHVRTRYMECNLGPGNSFNIPAGSMIKTGQCFSNIFDRVSGHAKLIKKPRVIAIDNLPVTGGPQNTPWRCIASSGHNGFKFTNGCTM